MKDYTFKVPQDIVFGVGSLKRLPELLEKSGSKKMKVHILFRDRSNQSLQFRQQPVREVK